MKYNRWWRSILAFSLAVLVCLVVVLWVLPMQQKKDDLPSLNGDLVTAEKLVASAKIGNEPVIPPPGYSSESSEKTELRCHYPNLEPLEGFAEILEAQQQEFFLNLEESRHPEDRLAYLIISSEPDWSETPSAEVNAGVVEDWLDYIHRWSGQELAIASLLTDCTYMQSQPVCQDASLLHGMIERSGNNGYLWQLAAENHLAQNQAGFAVKAFEQVYLASRYEGDWQRQHRVLLNAIERNLPARKIHQIYTALGYGAAIPIPLSNTTNYCLGEALADSQIRPHCRRSAERRERDAETFFDQQIGLAIQERIAEFEQDFWLLEEIRERIKLEKAAMNELGAYRSQAGFYTGWNQPLIENHLGQMFQDSELVLARDQLQYFRETYGPLLECD